MTFAYSVTDRGMVEQIVEVLRESVRGNDRKEEWARACYLAKHVMGACLDVLAKPAEVMEYIKKLVDYCNKRGASLEWTTPSGFPWANRYRKPTTKDINLVLQGVRVRCRAATGFKPEIDKQKSKNAAAPNVVHALDAAHLIRVVKYAAQEGIQMVCVHDSFGCTAPHAWRLHHIIRVQFALLYIHRDVLNDLRRAAFGPPSTCGTAMADQLADLLERSPRLLPPPNRSSLDLLGIQNSEYAFA
jgi:Autographiviridae RNA polymerase